MSELSVDTVTQNAAKKRSESHVAGHSASIGGKSEQNSEETR